MAKPPIDDRTVDRLLSGSIAPEDAPPGYDQVARVVRAAQAPASSSELAAQQSVASMAAAAVSNPVDGVFSPGRRARKRMVSKLATLRAAAITAAAVLGAGAAAAAATGSLPTQTNNASSHASGLLTAGSNVTSTTNDKNSTNGKPNSANPLNLPTTGPGNLQAVFGLCTAFLAHNSTTTTAGGSPSTSTPENDSTAFTALRKDAGHGTEATVAATVAWCNTYLSNNSPGNSGNAPDQGTAPSGKPSNPGNSGTHSSNTPTSGDAGTANTASHGDSLAGTSTANSVSGGASSAGSADTGRR